MSERPEAVIRAYIQGNGYEVVALSGGSRVAVPIDNAAALASLDALAAEVRQLREEYGWQEVRRAQNVYLYDQWGIRIARCENTEAHPWHGWVGGNQDLRCPGVSAALAAEAAR